MMKETPTAGNEIVKLKRSLRFKIGVFLLVVNVPFGYGGGALVAAIGVKMGQPALGAGMGVGIYIISWMMLGLGILMAGPEGVQLVKDLRKKWFRVKNAPSDPAAAKIAADNEHSGGTVVKENDQ
jgi:hypothetical protein